MNDGIYFDVIAIKDGVEYPVKRISVSEVSKTLTDSLMNGLGTCLDIPKEAMRSKKETK